MRSLFIYLAVFSLSFFSVAKASDENFLAFEIAKGDIKELEIKKIQLNNKGFNCRVIENKKTSSLICNDVRTLGGLEKEIRRFRSHNISFRVINSPNKVKEIPQKIPFYVGYKHLNKGEFRKALDIFERHYINSPRLEYATGYAISLYNLGHKKKALDVLSTYSNDVEISKLFRAYLSSHIDTLVELRQYRKAIDTVKRQNITQKEKNRLISKINNAQAIKLRARAVRLNQQKKYAASNKILKSLPKLKTEMESLYFGNLIAMSGLEAKHNNFAKAKNLLLPYKNKSKKVADHFNQIVHQHEMNIGWELLIKDPSQAIKHFYKACSIKTEESCLSGKMYAYNQLGWNYLTKYPSQAIKYFYSACDIKIEKSCLSGKMYAYKKIGNTEKVIEYAKKLYTKYQKDTYLVTLINAYQKINRPQKALLYQSLIKDKDIASQVLVKINSKIKLNYMERMLSYRSERKYEKCYLLAETHIEKTSQVDLLRLGGWCAYDNKNFHMAKHLFSAVVKHLHKPNDDDFYALALASKKSGDIERAKEALSQIENTNYMIDKIVSLYMAMDEFQLAKNIVLSQPTIDKDKIRKVNNSFKFDRPVSLFSAGMSQTSTKSNDVNSYFQIDSIPIDFDFLSSREAHHFYAEIDLLRFSGKNLSNILGNGTVKHPHSFDAIEGIFGVKTKHIQTEIGFSPSVLSNNPSFIGKAKVRFGENNWSAHAFIERQPIKDSFLSYVGQIATINFQQYQWGKAIKQGASIGVNIKDGERISYLVDVFHYPKITGKNLITNKQTKITGSAIYHTAIEELSFLDIGLTLVHDSYDFNSNIFSYGYGGYFSPQSFHLASLWLDMGGFVNDEFFYRFYGSLGYQTYSIDGSIIVMPSGITQNIASSKNQAISTNFSLQAGYQLTNNITSTFGIGWERSGEFEKYQIAVALSYQFESTRRARIQNLRDNHSIEKIIP